MAETERFGLASHLYVKLRRSHARVVDVAWMAQNDEYAKEILRIARESPDPDVAKIVERFEELLGIKRAAPAAAPAPVAKSAPKPVTALEKEVARHYTGHLR